MSKRSELIMSLPIPERLTVTEREMIQLISDGKLNKEIAPILRHTLESTENIRTKLVKKVGARNTANLVSIAYKEGILKF